MDYILQNYSGVISNYVLVVIALLGVMLAVGVIKRLAKFVVIVVIVAILWSYLGFSAINFESIKQHAEPALADITNRDFNVDSIKEFVNNKQ